MNRNGATKVFLRQEINVYNKKSEIFAKPLEKSRKKYYYIIDVI